MQISWFDGYIVVMTVVGMDKASGLQLTLKWFREIKRGVNFVLATCLDI